MKKLVNHLWMLSVAPPSYAVFSLVVVLAFCLGFVIAGLHELQSVENSFLDSFALFVVIVSTLLLFTILGVLTLIGISSLLFHRPNEVPVELLDSNRKQSISQGQPLGNLYPKLGLYQGDAKIRW